MGLGSWLGISSSPQTSPSTNSSPSNSPSNSSTSQKTSEPFQPPDRSSRLHCWDSRDIFFSCLDKNNIIDSVKNDATAREKCPTELKQFEKDCASSWVTYFKKRRVMEYQREETIKRLQKEGAEMV